MSDLFFCRRLPTQLHVPLNTTIPDDLLMTWNQVKCDAMWFCFVYLVIARFLEWTLLDIRFVLNMTYSFCFWFTPTCIALHSDCILVIVFLSQVTFCFLKKQKRRFSACSFRHDIHTGMISNACWFYHNTRYLCLLVGRFDNVIETESTAKDAPFKLSSLLSNVHEEILFLISNIIIINIVIIGFVFSDQCRWRGVRFLLFLFFFLLEFLNFLRFFRLL